MLLKAIGKSEYGNYTILNLISVQLEGQTGHLLVLKNGRVD
jgi:hypothetical protein